MKKIILTSLILIFSISTTFADCKTQISKKEYKLGNLEETILNIGEKIAGKSDKTKLIKLVGVLEKINGKNEKQRGILNLLKDYFNCEIKSTGLDVIGTIGTEPDLNNYNFTNGNDIINESEIKRYFDDFEKYRNGKTLFDLQLYNDIYSNIFVGTQEDVNDNIKKYFTWYRQNIYSNTKYWHRNNVNLYKVKSFINNDYQSLKLKLDQRVLLLKIAAKIIDELIPNGYVEYPKDNNIFHTNRFIINEWSEKITKLMNSNDNYININNERLPIYSSLAAIYEMTGTYKFLDGKYIDFIRPVGPCDFRFNKNGQANPEEHCYGDAAYKTFKIAPTHYEMCPGLFMYYGQKFINYSPYDIKYGNKNSFLGNSKNDDRGAFIYGCRPLDGRGNGNHPIGGIALWDRTRVFKIVAGSYTKSYKSVGGVKENLDKYLTANFENAKSYCSNKFYNNAKILKTVRVKSNTFKINGKLNTGEQEVIQYVKCWNGKPMPDPDLSKVNFSESKNFDYEIVNGTKVVNLVNKYYRKPILKLYSGDIGMPSQFNCTKETLGSEVTLTSLGQIIFKCQIHEESNLIGEYGYVNDLVSSKIWKVNKIVDGWKYIDFSGTELKVKDYDYVLGPTDNPNLLYQKEAINYNGKKYLLFRQIETVDGSYKAKYFRRIISEYNPLIKNIPDTPFYRYINDSYYEKWNGNSRERID